MNEREQALDILTRVQREDAFASPLIEAAGAATRERQFIRAMVMGVLRWRSLLDEWIVKLTARPLNKLDRATVDILRIGLFQIVFSEVEPHAAVNETVKVATRRAARAKGMVNAVLRQALRDGLGYEPVAATTPEAIASNTAHPLWMVYRWKKQYGLGRAAAICTANQQMSYPDLLVNTTKISLDDAEALIAARGYAVRRGRFRAEMLSIDAGTAELREEIAGGLLYPMDEGSAVVASLLSPDVKDVLDVAAAPGGKSLALQLLGHRVTAGDISLARLQTLRRAARHFGGDRNIALVASDGTSLPLRARIGGVLLDAPCSATGTIRRNPEIKWRLEEKALKQFAELQLRMLREALRVAEREVVYSTCSLEREENDDVVAAAIAGSDFEVVDLAAEVNEALRPWVEERVLRLTPESGCDGFTVHKLRREIR